jgi:hypothetical protein
MIQAQKHQKLVKTKPKTTKGAENDPMDFFRI